MTPSTNTNGQEKAGEALAEFSNDMAQASLEASGWIGRNGELVRNEKDGLLKELRRAGRIFRGCAKSAREKMCAGVFGPSQAGKSYLISALARGENNKLTAVFGKETHDFLSEINPQGGQESTGLVTRFTLAPPEGISEDYPVRARLLSETDIVKIIANTYYEDCEHKDAPKNDIGKTLAAIKTLPITGNNHVDLDVMEDLREYIGRNFISRARAADLERTYWDEAQVLAPKLDLEGRVKLYSIIWDEVEEFTELLRRLLGALESLGHPEYVDCPMDALLPRQSSIINVETLDGLSGKDTGPDLAIRARNGKEAKLSRAVVTALTAELTILMADKPAEYFEHTDLLDFPGYRSRYKFNDVRQALKTPNMLKELFRRGKVAYLFQRYCANRELNTMLLCIGPSNQEVQDLPAVINGWIAATHGEKPEEREGKPISLLFVLTKADEEFADKAGERDEDRKARWDIRLKASLLDFFGKQYDWPSHWTPTHGFNNIFLLRNPNYKFDAIMSYDGSQETGIRPERQDFVDKIHDAFLSSPLVKEHIREPAKSWNELMRLNDGGISFLRQSLEPLCDPKIKQRQLLKNINDCRERLVRRLGEFYKSDDREGLLRQKLLLLKEILPQLGALEKKQHRMGQLVREMAITDSEIFDMYPEARRRFLDMGEEGNDLAPQSDDDVPEDMDVSQVDLAAFNPFADDGETEETPEDNALQKDEEAFFAEYIESKWVERLHTLADDQASQNFFMLPPRLFSALASELATGAARLGFSDLMAAEFRKISAYANTRKESITRKQSAIAANMLNGYVDWLGYNPREKGEKDRTFQLYGGKTVTVFEPVPEIHGLPKIGETRSQYARRWLQDWTNALSSLITGNVYFDGQRSLNLEENAALGGILGKFKKTFAETA